MHLYKGLSSRVGVECGLNRTLQGRVYMAGTDLRT